MPEAQNLQGRKVLTEDLVNIRPLWMTEELSRNLKGQRGPPPPRLANLGLDEKISKRCPSSSCF